MELLEIKLKSNLSSAMNDGGTLLPNRVIDRLIIKTYQNDIKIFYKGEFIPLWQGDCLQLNDTLITVLAVPPDLLIANTAAITVENNAAFPSVLESTEPDFPLAHLTSEQTRFELDTLMAAKVSGDNDPLAFLSKKNNSKNGEPGGVQALPAHYQQPLPVLKQHFQVPLSVNFPNQNNDCQTIAEVAPFVPEKKQGNILQELGLPNVGAEEQIGYSANYLSHLPQNVPRYFNYQNNSQENNVSLEKQVPAMPAIRPVHRQGWLGMKELFKKLIME